MKYTNLLFRRSLAKMVLFPLSIFFMHPVLGQSEVVTPIITNLILEDTKCSTELSIASADIPLACSGPTYPPIKLNGQLIGYGNILIDSIGANLPPGTTGSLSFNVGDQLLSSASFTYAIERFPSASSFACVPANTAASLIVTYHCVDEPKELKTFSFDILAELYKPLQ